MMTSRVFSRTPVSLRPYVVPAAWILNAESRVVTAGAAKPFACRSADFSRSEILPEKNLNFAAARKVLAATTAIATLVCAMAHDASVARIDNSSRAI
jgi:hypothetical protein